MSQAAAEVHSLIDYLVPTSRINRRFWAPGKEFNTGIYAPYPVTIRNARLAGPFTLDAHGFCLGRHHTDISDWQQPVRRRLALRRAGGAGRHAPERRGLRRADGRHDARLRRHQRQRAAARRGGARRLHGKLRGAHRRAALPHGTARRSGVSAFHRLQPVARAVRAAAGHAGRAVRGRFGARRRGHAQHQGRRRARSPPARRCSRRSRARRTCRPRPSSTTRPRTAGGTSRTWSRRK